MRVKIKKYIFQFIPSVLLFCIVSAQSGPEIIWSKVIGGSNYDKGAKVQETIDGGLIILGTTYLSLVNNRIYLIKTDEEGNIQWEKTHGNYGINIGEDIRQTEDGGFIIAVNTERVFKIVKTDSIGNMLWENTYDFEWDNFSKEVIQTPDGGYILIGVETWTSPGGGGCKDHIIRTDSKGDTLWAKSFLGGIPGPLFTFTCAWPSSIDITPDGDIIIAGIHQNEIYLMKMNGVGDTLWTRTYGSSGRYNSVSIDITQDKGFIIGSTAYVPSNSLDIYLIKTDSNGEAEWTKTIGDTSANECFSIQQCQDGGYILTGRTGNHPYWNLFITKTDAIGNTVWTKTIGGDAGAEGKSIIQTNEGSFVLVGTTNLYVEADSDIWLIKLDSDLSTNAFEYNIPANYRLHQNHPNPFNPVTTIRYELPRSSHVRLSVYDILGREVAVLINTDQGPGILQVQWNATNIPSGIYFVRMTAGNFRKVRKVMVLK